MSRFPRVYRWVAILAVVCMSPVLVVALAETRAEDSESSWVDASNFSQDEATRQSKDETAKTVTKASKLSDEVLVSGHPTTPAQSSATVQVQPAALQDQPQIDPSQVVRPEVAGPQTETSFAADYFSRATFGLGVSQARPLEVTDTSNIAFILGGESKTRVATDLGNLLEKSPSARGVRIQKRTPIMNDPRVEGSRIGQTNASGSYWVPARLDLDTMVSKVDSRIIANALVVKGPYSALFGPGFNFVDIDFLPTPRFEHGFQWHGSTSADYKTNGEQFYGRQNLWGGGRDWGFRLGYGHRVGNDYTTGAGTEVPSSYNSANIDAAVGYDISDSSYIEINYLRLRQKDVEFPGYALDIDDLTTDGYDIRYVVEDQPHYDRLTFDVWHNQTQFDASAQRSGKRKQFPFFDFIRLTARSNVDSVSSGYSLAATWGDTDSGQLTVGTDLRVVQQQLNEFAMGRIGFLVFGGNSPIPKSFSANPGLFASLTRPVNDDLNVTVGARLDYQASEVTDDPARLTALGLGVPQSSLDEILGTNQYDQDRVAPMVFVRGDYALNDCWTLDAGAAYAQRPPSLTEFYAAQPFLFVLQNGVNTVTGDPQLNSEQRLQFDLGLQYKSDDWRAGIRGFHAWMFDYITYENLRTLGGLIEQVSLKYVNTELATLTGTEMYLEADWNDWTTPFATLSYVQATDQTRNGNFATLRAMGGAPSVRVAGLPRGFFSGVPGRRVEPLPSIPPLQARAGVRIHEPSEQPLWNVELAARMVAPQNRVARSLLETPSPGFTVWDLRGYWQAREDVLLVAGVENFTDKQYREHLDFRSVLNGISVFQPGISFYFGTEVSY